MSLTYSTFAVAGAGSLGSLIVSELLKQGAKVGVLSRGGNSKIPEGATIKVVDYTKPDELRDALQGVDVVVSALYGGGVACQPALADAAKEAGVKLFVPAEYGVLSHAIPAGGLLSFKPKFQHYLQSIGLPYTAYYVGLFADMPLFFFPGFDKETKTLANVGSPDVKFTLTARPDIAYFIAYTLTHVPASKLANARLGVEGEKLSWKEVAKVFGEKFPVGHGGHGGEWTLLNRDPAQVEKEIEEKGVAALGDYLFWLFSKGYGDVGQNHNALVPGWTPTTFAQAVEKYYTEELSHDLASYSADYLTAAHSG